MSKSFDATVQIVSARMSNAASTTNKEGGKAVAAFIHEIYKELSMIEIAEATELKLRPDCVVLKD